VLSISSPTAPTFQKVYGNCYVTYVIICSMGDVHYNVYCSKSKVHKLGFIATNDRPILFTIERKWLEIIVLITKFEFLNLAHSKQVQLFISIHVCGKFQLSPTFAFIGSKKKYNNLSQKFKKKLPNSWSPLTSSYSCVLYKLQPGCSDCYLLETTPKILVLSVTCPHHENKQTNRPTNQPCHTASPNNLTTETNSGAQFSL
jgi:hypothetical protein